MAITYLPVDTDADLRDLEAALWRRWYDSEILVRGLPRGAPLDHCPGDINVFLQHAPEYLGRTVKLPGEPFTRVWVTLRGPIGPIRPPAGEGGIFRVDEGALIRGTERASRGLAAWLDSVDNTPVPLPSAANLAIADPFERAMRVLGLRSVRDDVRNVTPRVGSLQRLDRESLSTRWKAFLDSRDTEVALR